MTSSGAGGACDTPGPSGSHWPPLTFGWGAVPRVARNSWGSHKFRGAVPRPSLSGDRSGVDTGGARSVDHPGYFDQTPARMSAEGETVRGECPGLLTAPNRPPPGSAAARSRLFPRLGAGPHGASGTAAVLLLVGQEVVLGPGQLNETS